MEINGFNVEPIEGEAGAHDVSFSPASVNESIDKTVEIDAVVGDKTARVTLFHEGLRELFNVTEGAFSVSEGTFNVLKFPAGYTRLEYVESNGGQYIDTGFVPNQDTRVKMSILASGLSGETYAYGARNSAGSNAFLCALEPSAITFGYAKQYRAYEGVIDGSYDIDQNKNIMTVNGTELSGNYVESFSSESNLTLFGRNTAGSVENLSAIKIYSCQIYDNDALVRDYIPAKNSNGQQGLYDLVNNTFYSLITA